MYAQYYHINFKAELSKEKKILYFPTFFFIITIDLLTFDTLRILIKHVFYGEYEIYTL